MGDGSLLEPVAQSWNPSKKEKSDQMLKALSCAYFFLSIELCRQISTSELSMATVGSLPIREDIFALALTLSPIPY